MCPVMSHCWTHQRLAKSLAILSPSWRRRCKDELQSYPFQLRRRWQSDSASHWICGLLHPCWSTPLWSFMDGSVGTFEVWLMYGVSVSFECYDMLWLMTQYCLEDHQNISERRKSFQSGPLEALVGDVTGDPISALLIDVCLLPRRSVQAWFFDHPNWERWRPKLGGQEWIALITLWLFNIAMENGPFIDGLPIKNDDFPWLC